MDWWSLCGWTKEFNLDKDNKWNGNLLCNTKTFNLQEASDKTILEEIEKSKEDLRKDFIENKKKKEKKINKKKDKKKVKK